MAKGSGACFISFTRLTPNLQFRHADRGGRFFQAALLCSFGRSETRSVLYRRIGAVREQKFGDFERALIVIGKRE